MKYRIVLNRGNVIDEEGKVVLEGAEILPVVTLDLALTHGESSLHEGFFCGKCNKMIDPPKDLDPCTIVSIACPDCGQRALPFSASYAVRGIGGQLKVNHESSST